MIERYNNCETIVKYQTGEKLVGCILSIYSEKNPNEVHVQSGNKRTKVVGVYSPAGGTGKTTLAVGTAMHCTYSSMSVFYLNIENNPSTSLFFNSDSQQNLSHIIYYLKEKNRNLSLKIEGARLVDPQSGIHYFAPPESTLELEEMTSDEIKYLIQELKLMGVYDVVLVDMSPGLNSRNTAVLEMCDEIFMVLAEDMVSYTKAKSLEQDLMLISKKTGMNLLDRTTLILNKFNTVFLGPRNEVSIGNKTVRLRIPVVTSLLIYQSGKCTLNLENNFGEAVKGLVNKLYQ